MNSILNYSTNKMQSFYLMKLLNTSEAIYYCELTNIFLLQHTIILYLK